MRKKSKVYLGIFLSAAMLMGTYPVEAGEINIFSDEESIGFSENTSTKVDNNEQNVFEDGNADNAGYWDDDWDDDDDDDDDWDDDDDDDWDDDDDDDDWDDDEDYESEKLYGYFFYKNTKDGNVIITKYAGKEENVVVPEEINDRKVIEISNSAFKGNTYITSVKLPSSISKLENYVFCDCENLKLIDMPGVTEIGYHALGGCHNLENIDLSKITKLSPNALFATGIKEAYLPNLQDTEISCWTFASCHNLESIFLPDVTTIDEEAFSGCEKLTTVKFPEVKVIGENAFEECTSLKNIDIPNVTKIEDYAFQYCSSMERINLKKTKTIGMYAFKGCKSLSYVEFGKKLKLVDSGAFLDCPSYTFIIFPDLESLEIKSSAFGYVSTDRYGNSKFTDAITFHCEANSNINIYAIKHNIPFTVHKYKDNIVKPATENKSGQIISVCDICGQEDVEEEIPKLMDIFVDSDIIYNGKVQKPNIIVKDEVGDNVSTEYYDIIYNEEAIEPGEYTVTLNFKGIYSGTKILKYYIKDDVAKIKASNMTVTLGSKNKKLNVKVVGDYNGLSYKSSNSKIVSVSADGKITAKKVGTAVITITAGATDRHEAVTKKIKVKVIPQKTKLISVTKAGKGKLKLIWKTVPGVDGYIIYRDADKVKTIKGNTISSYTDSSLANGTRYDYEVRTYKKVNGKVYYSNYSNTKIATTAVVNVNYEGSYKSSSGELAIYKEGYKYDYVATVSLTRLCTLERLRCNKVNGHLEFAGYDPSGNIIYGTIKKSGNKVTFKITDTTWIYFDDGDTYIFYE